jgi:hypothetical protein
MLLRSFQPHSIVLEDTLHLVELIESLELPFWLQQFRQLRRSSKILKRKRLWYLEFGMIYQQCKADKLYWG